MWISLISLAFRPNNSWSDSEHLNSHLVDALNLTFETTLVRAPYIKRHIQSAIENVIGRKRERDRDRCNNIALHIAFAGTFPYMKYPI